MSKQKNKTLDSGPKKPVKAPDQRVRSFDGLVCTGGALADILGISEQRTYELADQNVTKRVGEGTFDLKGSVLGYVQRLKDNRAGRGQGRAGEVSDEGVGEGTAPVVAADVYTHTQLAKMKVLRQVESLDFELAKKRGEYISRDKVREASLKAGSLLSAELLSIVGDTPGVLAGENELTVKAKLQSRLDTMEKRFIEALQKAEKVESE